MALNSPLLQSLIDKINYKHILELNSICNIPYTNINMDNIHCQSDPLQEMFIILWKCYTIYYTLFDNVEICSIISMYNRVINKIISNEQEQSISIRTTITNNVKIQKIKELNTLIKRFKYLKNIVVNKGEKVQIGNLWDRSLNNYPFYSIHDSQIIKNPTSISEVTGYDDKVYNPSNRMLIFIVDKKSGNLIAHIIKKEYRYDVYNNDISYKDFSNYVIKLISKILRHKIQVIYKYDIPILVLHKDFIRIFAEYSNILNKIKHEYSPLAFNEFLNINNFNKTCNIYYFNIPNIKKYSTALTTEELYTNKKKLVAYHNKLVAPYNLEDDTKTKYLDIDNMVNVITLHISKLKYSNIIDKACNNLYNNVMINLYKISNDLYNCEQINTTCKNIILGYIRRMLINKVYKKQFDSNLYNYLVPIHNNLLSIVTKYKLCNDIKTIKL